MTRTIHKKLRKCCKASAYITRFSAARTVASIYFKGASVRGHATYIEGKMRSVTAFQCISGTCIA